MFFSLLSTAINTVTTKEIIPAQYKKPIETQTIINQNIYNKSLAVKKLKSKNDDYF